MRVTFHGVRGSIPTPGPTTVRYGGNTVCVEVRLADGTTLLLDAGTGLRELGRALARGPLPTPLHLFITHAHWDHIMGLPFFAPVYRADAEILFHAFSRVGYERWQKKILFDGTHFPVRAEDIPARMDCELVEGALRVGSATVRRIPLNHPGGSDGFRIDDADGASLCYLTDNELVAPAPLTTTLDELARFSAGVGMLIHDSQYLVGDMPAKRGWGHSVVDDVLELGRAAEARRLVLHHHDPERDDDALDRIARDAAAWTGARAPALECLVAAEGLTLDV